MPDDHTGHDHMFPADSALWQADAFALVGTVLIAVVAVAYLFGASRFAGARTWSPVRIGSFVGGLAVLAVTLFSGIANRHSAVSHVVQCLIVMMVVAPMLVAGAPLRLLSTRLPPAMRAAIAETSRDPLVRRLSTGRSAAILLTVDYYGSMALYMLTPLYRLSTEHLWIHIAAHAYFLLCGLVFWSPLLGRNAAGWRPSRHIALVMTAVGIPANVLIGFAVVALAPVMAGLDPADLQRSGMAFVAVGVLFSALGVGLVVVTWSRDSAPSKEELTWPVVS